MAIENQKIVTPTGTAYYAHLFKPAVFEGEETNYEVNVVFDNTYTEKLKQMIDTALAQAKESEQFAGKKWAEHPQLSYRETEIEDEIYGGATVFKFKMKPEGKNRKTGEVFRRKVVVFDAMKQPVQELAIGNGTKLKVCAQIAPYYKSAKVHGIGLYMEAVQIIELKEYTGGVKSADHFGFEVEENGFTADAFSDYSAEREAAEIAAEDGCEF